MGYRIINETKEEVRIKVEAAEKGKKNSNKKTICIIVDKKGWNYGN